MLGATDYKSFYLLAFFYLQYWKEVTCHEHVYIFTFKTPSNESAFQYSKLPLFILAFLFLKNS